MLLISTGGLRCASPKTGVWIPEGCALAPEIAAPFAHVGVENAVATLEVALPAVAQRGKTRWNAGKVASGLDLV